MTEQFSTALIASAISMLAILISSAINSREIKQQDKDTQKQLNRAMTQKLYDLRIKLYPKAFEITEALKQYKPPKFANTKEETDHILKLLMEWKTGEVSLALSSTSLYFFGRLRKNLRRTPAGTDGFFSREQAQSIHRAKVVFRRSLRRDVGFLFDEE